MELKYIFCCLKKKDNSWYSSDLEKAYKRIFKKTVVEIRTF